MPATKPRATITSTPWLTPDDLAALTGVAVGTLRNWRSQGTGPRFIKLGAVIHYPQAEIDLWIAEQARISARGMVA